MPAHAKIAAAVALSLALVGAGTSLAQSTTAPAGHSVYVTLVGVEGAAGPEELSGQVPCHVPLHERVIRRTLGRQVCRTDDYAYAYPQGEPAPWRGDIQEVDDQMHVDRNGSMWRVTEITYRTMAEAPEGGPELVHAMASEIVPTDGGEGLSYSLPVNEDLVNGSSEGLVVDVGPSPTEVAPPPVADTTLSGS